MNNFKYFILSILSFTAILSPVYADSGVVSSVTAGYGYTQYLNDEITDRKFNTFSSSNLSQDLTSLPNDTTVYIDEFDLRVTVPNKFQANYNYTITFTWIGYPPLTSNASFANYKSFYELFQYFDNYGRCRTSNWNGTNLEADSCFKNYNMSYVLNPLGNNDGTVEVTITFTPKITFFGFTTYFMYGNKLADPRLPLNAWTVQEVEYSTNYITSGDTGGGGSSSGGVTSNDIDNIINNQTQNTQDIIDSITDDDIGSTGDELSDFLTGFEDNDTTGLSGIVTAPLRVFDSFLNAKCESFTIPIYKQYVFEVPCLQSNLSEETKNSTYFVLLQTLLTGVVAYACVVSLFHMVNRLKNPDDDRVEVIDL